MLKLFSILKDIRKTITLIAAALILVYLLSDKILTLGIINNNKSLAFFLLFLIIFFGGAILLAVISNLSRTIKKNRGTIDGDNNEVELDNNNAKTGSSRKTNELKISGSGNSVKIDVNNGE